MGDLMKYAQNISAPMSKLADVRIERVDSNGDTLFEGKLNKLNNRTDICSFFENPLKLKWQPFHEKDNLLGCYAIQGEYKIFLISKGAYGIEMLQDDFDAFMSS